MNEQLKLNIQLFAEEADNDTEIADGEVEFDETEVDDVEPEEEIEQPVEVDQTKAFSERLKSKSVEIEKKAKDEAKADMDRTAQLRGYKDWEAFEKAITEDTILDMGVKDPDQFEKFVKGLIEKDPMVVKAKKLIEEQEASQGERELQEQVNKIMSDDSSIKTLDDIFALPNYKEIYEKVQKGYSLHDAYVIVNKDKIMLSKAETAKKQVITNLDSKGHLKNATGAGGVEVKIPQDIMDGYKRNLPGWSDEQIKNHYIKVTKGDVK